MKTLARILTRLAALFAFPFLWIADKLGKRN